MLPGKQYFEKKQGYKMISETYVVEYLTKHPKGLRAKVIAKDLGINKAELNRYLHDNKDILYFQDNDWKWTVNYVEYSKRRIASIRAVLPEQQRSNNDMRISAYSNDKKKSETMSEYIDRMIDSFSFENEEEFLKADLTRYIGDEVNPKFSEDLTRKLRFKKLIKHGKLQRMLESVLGKGARFREGQEEAILALAEGKHVLVVQHTGWGKSLVYFLTTKLFRSQGMGPTVIVSPLLALMHNQIESAEKYELTMRQITSDTQNEWEETYKLIAENKVDVIFLSPERLADERFMAEFADKIGQISLFAVDEAHCISDWGHDFRPDFRRIVKYVKGLPEGTPVLATTATANNRVLRDIKHQLGSNLEIQRGTMDRPSIDVDVLKFKRDAEKIEWLKRNINNLPGTGIIYCLTRNTCEILAHILAEYVPAVYYHARLSAEEKWKREKDFQENRVKVLVATIAFGMGIDKPDIGFVIHYQQPANVVAYYQQIGRAGRNINKSYAIALVGEEDNQINSYFISHAFPTEDQMNKVVDYVVENRVCSRQQIIDELGVSKDWADKVLKYLCVNGDIEKKNHRYYKTSKKWTCDMKRARIVSWYRWKELREFNRFLDTKECYMKYMRRELDDQDAKSCGHCANCLNHHFWI